ncbi:hypothetical protein ACIOWI_37220 [Streptomyces sp. NPDC087659]|uniref:hypothetical protein n=1 Tax=Streptomyces sp. NPDC087659 TaxID=3365801 RepID=UPI0038102E9E
MYWLHEVTDDLEKRVFDEVANLLNLEVDLLFFDTTSTYFEREDTDEPVARDDKGRLLTDDRPPADEDGEPRIRPGSVPSAGRTFTGPTGLFRQVTALTKPQTDLLAKLGIPAPKQIITLEPAPR